ncbi:MAG: right-handed parallel beta-helix repeat-containing protein [Myxococcales bacterium]|nr:right-handed parallel beta-helix repeat-containing protein [Myxococcales bacterium]
MTDAGPSDEDAAAATDAQVDAQVDAPACPDADGDGVCDDSDACEGDDATGDSDDDGVCDDSDACVGKDESGDSDDDGVCDDSDTCAGHDDASDGDGDGVPDGCDACVGDDASGDSDGDDVCDDADLCRGDDASGDSDGDGVCDDSDNCVPIFNPDQEDVVEPLGSGDACSVVFVRAGASGAGDGTSWDDAYVDVQAAVTAAQADQPAGPLRDIWIAEGTYRASSANAAVLTMVPGLEVYGGFAGTESRFSERPDPPLETVLSGDHLGNDAALDGATVEAERSDPDQPTRSDNASQVVTVESDTVLDGVVVSGGYTVEVQLGVGIVVPGDATLVSLRSVTIRDNVGAVLNANGVGLGINPNATVKVESCLFVANIAWNGAGAFVSSGAAVEVSDSRFEDNVSIGGQGSGLYSAGGVTIENTVFFANQLIGNGGGAYLGSGGTGSFLNVLFDSNIGRRGAAQTGDAGTHEFTNVTIANTISTGSEGAVWAGSSDTFVNTIFWNNQAGDFANDGTHRPASVIHSCSAEDLSDFVGGDNVRLDSSTAALGDPFAVGSSGEFFLKHTSAGDAVTSACVDAGDTEADPDSYFPLWSSLTTRSDGVLDGASSDAIDIGYHYAP